MVSGICFEALLEPEGRRCYFFPMRHGPFARLRALILLAAFGIGLAGQAMAAAPMPLAQHDGTGAAVAMGAMDGCHGCAASDSSNPSSKALMPGCGTAFCSVSVSPATLTQGPMIVPSHDGTFIPTPTERGQGISIRPDLGPPRAGYHA